MFIKPQLCGVCLHHHNLNKTHFVKADMSNSDLLGSECTLSSFTNADLHNANLGLVNFTASNLSSANLRNANCEGSVFRRAFLKKTNLQDANLNKTVLINASFKDCNLKNASMLCADIRDADINNSVLCDADFGEAILDGTVFANTDLSSIKNLETTQHFAPSYIDTYTIQKSHGKIPKLFLRGCGLSDLQIEMVKLHSPDLSHHDVIDITHKLQRLYANKPIRFQSCFICHSTKDQEFADKLYSDLQRKGVRCWFAPKDIRAGEKIYSQIVRALNISEKLLLILSDESIQSEWVITEIRRIRKQEIEEGVQKLLPIRLTSMRKLNRWECFDVDTGKDLAVEIREYHIPDFSKLDNEQSYQTAFDRLLRDLKMNQ